MRDLAEGAIFIRRKRNRAIVLVEQIGDASAFLRGVERASGQIVDRDFLHVQIPYR